MCHINYSATWISNTSGNSNSNTNSPSQQHNQIKNCPVTATKCIRVYVKYEGLDGRTAGRNEGRAMTNR